MSEPGEFDVLCVGQAVQDLVFAVDHHPGPDEKATAIAHLRCGGGPAANASATVARLGLRAAFFGYLGRDDFGTAHLKELLEFGVDTRYLRRGDAPTPVSTIIVHPDASRTVINFKDKHAATTDAQPKFDVRQARTLLFDGHEPQISKALASAARALGVPTILDAGSLHEGTEALTRLVHTVICSKKFAEQWSGSSRDEDMLRSLAPVAPEIVITLGERGLIWARGGSQGRLPALDVHAVDTTGAGDVFHGAFAAGTALGWVWESKLEFSSAAAALACTKLGGRPGIPTRDEVERFLQEHADSDQDPRP